MLNVSWKLTRNANLWFWLQADMSWNQRTSTSDCNYRRVEINSFSIISAFSGAHIFLFFNWLKWTRLLLNTDKHNYFHKFAVGTHYVNWFWIYIGTYYKVGKLRMQNTNTYTFPISKDLEVLKLLYLNGSDLTVIFHIKFCSIIHPPTHHQV